MLVYPALPATTCAAKPQAPAADASDNDLAAYTRARFDAGDDCRAKLGAVHDTQASWPKTAAPSPAKGN